MVEVMRKLQKLEADHAKELGKLTDKSLAALPSMRRGSLAKAAEAGSEDGLPLASTWVACLEEAQKRALKQEEYASALLNQVIVPLGDTVRELDLVRKSLMNAGTREQKTLQEMHSGLKTAQTSYLKEKEAAADAEAKLARARSAPNKKEKEIKKCTEKAAAAGSKLAAMSDSLRLHEAQCEERQKWLYEEKFPELQATPATPAHATRAAPPPAPPRPPLSSGGQARLQREDVRRANQLLTGLESWHRLGQARPPARRHLTQRGRRTRRPFSPCPSPPPFAPPAGAADRRSGIVGGAGRGHQFERPRDGAAGVNRPTTVCRRCEQRWWPRALTRRRGRRTSSPLRPRARPRSLRCRSCPRWSRAG